MWPQFAALALIGGMLFALSLAHFRKTIAQMGLNPSHYPSNKGLKLTDKDH